MPKIDLFVTQVIVSYEQVCIVINPIEVIFGQGMNSVRISHVCSRACEQKFHHVMVQAKIRTTAIAYTFTLDNGLDNLTGFIDCLIQLNTMHIKIVEYRTTEDDFNLSISMNAKGGLEYRFHLSSPGFSNEVEVRLMVSGDQSDIISLIDQIRKFSEDLDKCEHSPD